MGVSCTEGGAGEGLEGSHSASVAGSNRVPREKLRKAGPGRGGKVSEVREVGPSWSVRLKAAFGWSARLVFKTGPLSP